MTTTFAAELKRRRKEKGMSQTQLAIKTGIARHNLAAYEENRAQPPMDKFLKICEAFGITNLLKT